jgi:hypothetical protein
VEKDGGKGEGDVEVVHAPPERGRVEACGLLAHHSQSDHVERRQAGVEDSQSKPLLPLK